MTQRRKKQAFTLLEIMIVICLIGLIGGVISYNMKGSLEEGKAFKTVRAKDQIYDILMLEVAKGATLEEVVKAPKDFLEQSGLVKDAKALLVDGWNVAFDIQVNSDGNDLVIQSAGYERYQQRKSPSQSASKKTQSREVK